MPDTDVFMSPLPTEKQFVHLHLHSEYSLLDGGNRIDKLIARVQELGMGAVAVTDHGNIHGAVQFYEKAKRAGIKPILGVEAYVAPGDRRDRTYTGVQDGGWHLVLLAENDQGWRNLLHLCSEAYRTGFYFKPRMDRELLEEFGEGLIAINGHLGSEIAHHLCSFERTKDEGHWAKAVEVAEWHQRVFAPKGGAKTGGTPVPPEEARFYVELQHHVPEQNAINPHLIRLAKQVGAPLVCDNDSHFLLAEDHDAHDTLICISMGKSKQDPDRLRYTPELYVKSPQQMREIFEGLYGEDGREACDNTVKIADRCDVNLDIGANHAPMVLVRTPEGLPSHDDAKYGGDLTAWYNDYSSRFELSPFDMGRSALGADPEATERRSDGATKGAGARSTEGDPASTLDPRPLTPNSPPDSDSIKEQCDRALRLLCEAGMVWRYGPQILEHRHELVEGSDEAAERRSDAGVDEAAFDKWARLNRELKILADKLISAYFLIVWDFVNWGRQRGIPANARGSGVGTMVGYVLGLSNACPVRYGLLFERFTDPDRSEYPDIDIDLCQDGRGEVIDYVRSKYGHVAQIITFGTLKARAAVRDVCRVLEVPLAEADKLAKMIPETLGMTLKGALEENPDLKARYDSDEQVRQVIDTGIVLEGQARHAGVHAAGVVLANRPLSEIVPLYRQSGSAEHEIVTQWDGPTCEKMGLLKMDFLGLRTLSVIERCKRLIRETMPERAVWAAVGREEELEGRDGVTERRRDEVRAHPLDLERLDFRDQRVFELFQRADTVGVFQFESGGMRRLLLDMKPDRLEDLIAANALFRPGPMDLIPDYNRRKHGTEQVPKVHPIVDRFTAETYGVMVYQEQVMQIASELGGIPLREAYSLIKAISKKKKAVIDASRPRFVQGAGKKGLDKARAEELFELILKFAGYGFNKSHSTGYAIVAYQTAYLKTYFPRHYMAAFLSFESQAQKVANWIPYLDDCKRTRAIDPKTGEILSDGIRVAPPSINLSQADFSVVYDEGEEPAAHAGHIRFGLRAIKGAGGKAIEAIIAERDGETKRRRDEVRSSSADASSPATSSLRLSVSSSLPSSPYRSLHDFCERVPTSAVNKATIEALIKSGAFDEVHGREMRAAMVASIDAAVSAGQKIAQDKASGQNQLFGFGGGEAEPAAEEPGEAPLVKVEPWSETETLRQEKDTLGFYVSSHPLDEWRHWTGIFPTMDLRAVREQPQDRRVIVPAMVQSVREIIVRNGRSAGQKMAVLTLEDLAGTIEAVLFTDNYARFGHLVHEPHPCFVLGRVDLGRGDPQIIVDQLVPIQGSPLMKGRLRLRLRDATLNGTAQRALAELQRALTAAAPNGAPAAGSAVALELAVETEAGAVLLQPQRPSRVSLEPQLVQRVGAILGEPCAQLVGGVALEVEEDRRPRRNGKG